MRSSSNYTRKKISIFGAAGEIGSKTAACIISDLQKDEYVELVLLNRTFDKLKARVSDLKSFMSAMQDTTIRSRVKVTPTTDVADISDSDIVILASGISAGRSGFNNRESALPAISFMVRNIARDIGKYASECLVLVVTNPVDIVTRLIFDECGATVIGVGSGLDATRFNEAFEERLKAIEGFEERFGEIRKVESIVIGGHSEERMIIVDDEIKIHFVNNEGEKIIRGLKSFTGVDHKQVTDVYKMADQHMRSEGFNIVRSLQHGASFAPARLLADYANAFLYSQHPKIVTGSFSLNNKDCFNGHTEAVASVPLAISKGSVSVVDIELDNLKCRKFNHVIGVHNQLVSEAKTVRKTLAERIETGLRAFDVTLENFRLQMGQTLQEMVMEGKTGNEINSQDQTQNDEKYNERNKREEKNEETQRKRPRIAHVDSESEPSEPFLVGTHSFTSSESQNSDVVDLFTLSSASYNSLIPRVASSNTLSNQGDSSLRETPSTEVYATNISEYREIVKKQKDSSESR